MDSREEAAARQVLAKVPGAGYDGVLLAVSWDKAQEGEGARAWLRPLTLEDPECVYADGWSLAKVYFLQLPAFRVMSKAAKPPQQQHAQELQWERWDMEGKSDGRAEWHQVLEGGFGSRDAHSTWCSITVLYACLSKHGWWKHPQLAIQEGLSNFNVTHTTTREGVRGGSTPTLAWLNTSTPHENGEKSAACKGFNPDGSSVHCTQVAGPAAAACKGFNPDGSSVHCTEACGPAAAACKGFRADGSSVHCAEACGPAAAACKGFCADCTSVHCSEADKVQQPYTRHASG